MAVCERTGWLVFASDAAESYVAVTGWRRGTVTGHCGVWRLCFHGSLSSCFCKDNVGLLVLCADAMDLLMHRDFLGEDNEKGRLCGSQKLRIKQTQLPAARFSLSSVPSFDLAR